MKQVRVLIAVATLAAIVGLVFTAGSGAQPDAKNKEVIEKMVDAVAKGDLDTGRKLAKDLFKKNSDLEELAAMDLFKKKDKGGWGFGAGPKETDGIEVKLREIARDGITPASAKKDAKLYELMAQRIIAINLVAEAYTPAKDKGMAKVKNWTQYAKDMQEGAQALAKAKGAEEIKKAATKVNNACIACHSEWRNK
jgi:hypothetical protein